MPQMERNLDLESVDSDALFGLEALRHQSIGQKILFYGCLIAGVLANTVMPKLLHTPGIVNVLTFTLCLLIGIAGGCNYTQDIPYGKYLFLMLFEKKQMLRFRSAEDVLLKEKTVDQKEPDQKKEDPKEHRRMAVNAVLIIIGLILMLTGIYFAKGYKEQRNIHHEIERSMDE